MCAAWEAPGTGGVFRLSEGDRDFNPSSVSPRFNRSSSFAATASSIEESEIDEGSDFVTETQEGRDTQSTQGFPRPASVTLKPRSPAANEQEGVPSNATETSNPDDDEYRDSEDGASSDSSYYPGPRRARTTKTTRARGNATKHARAKPKVTIKDSPAGDPDIGVAEMQPDISRKDVQGIKKMPTAIDARPTKATASGSERQQADAAYTTVAKHLSQAKVKPHVKVREEIVKLAASKPRVPKKSFFSELNEDQPSSDHASSRQGEAHQQSQSNEVNTGKKRASPVKGKSTNHGRRLVNAASDEPARKNGGSSSAALISHKTTAGSNEAAGHRQVGRKNVRDDELVADENNDVWGAPRSPKGHGQPVGKGLVGQGASKPRKGKAVRKDLEKPRKIKDPPPASKGSPVQYESTSKNPKQNIISLDSKSDGQPSAPGQLQDHDETPLPPKEDLSRPRPPGYTARLDLGAIKSAAMDTAIAPDHAGEAMDIAIEEESLSPQETTGEPPIPETDESIIPEIDETINEYALPVAHVQSQSTPSPKNDPRGREEFITKSQQAKVAHFDPRGPDVHRDKNRLDLLQPKNVLLPETKLAALSSTHPAIIDRKRPRETEHAKDTRKKVRIDQSAYAEPIEISEDTGSSEYSDVDEEPGFDVHKDEQHNSITSATPVPRSSQKIGRHVNHPNVADFDVSNSSLKSHAPIRRREDRNLQIPVSTLDPLYGYQKTHYRESYHRMETASQSPPGIPNPRPYPNALPASAPQAPAYQTPEDRWTGREQREEPPSNPFIRKNFRATEAVSNSHNPYRETMSSHEHRKLHPKSAKFASRVAAIESKENRRVLQRNETSEDDGTNMFRRQAPLQQHFSGQPQDTVFEREKEFPPTAWSMKGARSYDAIETTTEDVSSTLHQITARVLSHLKTREENIIDVVDEYKRNIRRVVEHMISSQEKERCSANASFNQECSRLLEGVYGGALESVKVVDNEARSEPRDPTLTMWRNKTKAVGDSTRKMLKEMQEL
ncbi:hypothetical protein F4778DRAFT_105524 [Xylariomycetidae sp. FL2044]|nr:hypothetical protein F4778DRAFT_105524 [Xylariomycetidae sp. FL2044]